MGVVSKVGLVPVTMGASIVPAGASIVQLVESTAQVVMRKTAARTITPANTLFK